MRILVFIFPIIIYYLSVRFFLDSLLESRHLTIVKKILLALYVLLANYLCLYYTATSQYPFGIFMLNYAITFLLALCLYKVGIKQLILLCFIYSLLGLFTERLVYLFLFGGQAISVHDNFYIRLIVDIVLLIFTKIWQSYFKDRELPARNDGYPLFLIFLPLVSILVLHYLIATDKNQLTLRSLIECFFIFSLNLFIFLLFDQMREREAVKSENLLYAEQLMFYEKYNAELEKHQLAIEINNHDFKNHLISISGYLNEGKYDELKRYLDSIVLTEASPAITGCATIDALFYYFQNKFSAQNIDWQLQAFIPNELPFEASDISIILGNLLQNAYEELAKIKANNLKKVRMELHYDANKLLIVCENPYETVIKKDSQNYFLSTKEGKHRQRRGLGIKSIFKTLDNYPHLIDIETNKQIFAVTIVLFVENNKKDKDR